MARPRIVLDHSGMADVLRSDEVRAPLREIAEQTAARARSGAPVDSGEYADKIHVDSVTTDRAVERVVASARHSIVVEARTGNLKRALGG